MGDVLRFHPDVPSDVSHALQWYGNITAPLAERFRQSLDSRFDDIAARPESFAFAFENVRFGRVRRFPYLVLFREVGEVVQILGGFHTASDPAKWRLRGSDA
jgi:hypothetical protein